MKHYANEPATKGDLERFATKTDLERFATKTDLERFATKTDLELLAIRTDLERFATKDDLNEFKDEIRQEMRGFKNRVALDALEVRSDVGALGEKLSKLILQTRSDLMGAVESAVFKAEKVDRAQILMGDRLGNLEGRVAALESPRTPPHP
jgi:hypothetical protein